MNIASKALVLAAATVGAAMPAWAHHSFGGYDMTKTMTAHATIKAFHWGAPHSEAEFLILSQDGKAQQILLQGAAPGAMIKQGFHPKDLRPGDTVTITWHPSRIGSGGQLATILFSDGRVFKDTEGLTFRPQQQPGAAPGAGAPPGGPGAAQ